MTDKIQMPNSPTLSVVISVLNWNTADATLACVDKLLAQEAPTGVEVAIHVTDNGSAQADYERLRGALPAQARLQRNPKNLGFAGGHNGVIGAAIERGVDFVWLFNSDALLTQGATLEALLRPMLADSRCGAVSPMLANTDGRLYFRGGWHDWRNLKSSFPPLAECQRIQDAHPADFWVSGATVLLRSAALREVGLLNEAYFAYYEDNEICARLAAAGWRSKVAFDVTVQHHMPKKETDRGSYYFYLMRRNYLYFWYQNTPPQHRRLLWFRLLDQALFDCNRLYAHGFRAHGDAALLGIYDFLLGRAGAFDLNRRVPFLLRCVQSLVALQQSGAIRRESMASTANT